MDETYRVSAILGISSDDSMGQSQNLFFRQPRRQQSFDFSPFFRNACDDLKQAKEDMRATQDMNRMIRMPLRMQRA